MDLIIIKLFLLGMVVFVLFWVSVILILWFPANENSPKDNFNLSITYEVVGSSVLSEIQTVT